MKHKLVMPDDDARSARVVWSKQEGDVTELCIAVDHDPPALWQPIETAPKDGAAILLGSAKACADGYWLQAAYGGNGAWIWPYIHRTPTHWMPLVPVPSNAIITGCGE